MAVRWTWPDAVSADQLGPAETSRFVALFGSWLFRLLALVAAVPLLARQWGTDATALVLWVGLAEAAVAAVAQPWAGATVARVRTLIATGDTARAGRASGTVLAAALLATAVLVVAAVVGAPWLGQQLSQFAAHAEPLQAAVPLALLELALLPLAVTLTALGVGALGPKLANRLQGWLGLAAVAALLVAAAGEGVATWAALSLGGTVAVLVWLAATLVRRRALRGLGLAWSELVAVVRTSTSVPSVANLWNLPVLVASLLLAAQLGLASHFADLALVSLAIGLGNWGDHVAATMGPPHSAGQTDDPDRLRWRFGRHYDAANLVAVGTFIALLCYLGLASRLWLAKLGPVAAPVYWLGLWAGGVAPSRVLGEQLVRQDRGALRLAAHGLELVAVFVVNSLVGGDSTAAALACALAVRWGGTLALGLPAICMHFHISYTRITLGTAWRFGLVALPASVTGAAFAWFRPPLTGREWALQLCILGILYLVPAFTAWNLMDTRRDRNA